MAHTTHPSESSGQHEQPARPHYDDIDTPVVLMIGLISAICTVLVIGLVEGITYRWEADLTRERIEVVNQTVAESIEVQKADLTKVVDEKGAPIDGRITIDDAMGRVLERFGSARESSTSHIEGNGAREKNSIAKDQSGN